MRSRTLLTASLMSGVLALTAACGSSTPATSSAPAPAAASTATGSTTGTTASRSATPVSALKKATTPLGDVVTDGNGMTLYMFTKDSKGTTTSACTGACLKAWPPALMEAAPSLTGVTGTVASIAAPGGGKQLTLNGWPLYYFAKDAAAGDTTGQGVGGVWWVLDSTGSPVMAATTSGY
jgi:predicted lipoprotein with Yx(FWY)xxD motif